MSLYVIKASSTTDTKYYVGISQNVDERLDKHFCGNSGVAWVQKYLNEGRSWVVHEIVKPVIIDGITHDCTEFAENVLTKEYMSTYGIENVRGGRWSQIDLKPFVVEELTMEFRSAKGLCFVCGFPGHQSRECKRGNLHQKTECNAISLWCTLNGPYNDTISDNEVHYSGQRGGKTDHLVKVGAYFFYRESAGDKWIPCGQVLEVTQIGHLNGLSKFKLTLPSTRGIPIQGKSRALESVGLQVPSRDKWEMSGIIQH